jgi:hypothetical protein
MKLLKPIRALSLIALSLSLLSACGNSRFATQGYNSTTTATGTNDAVVTRGKVDIVIFQDNSDSVIYGPVNDIKNQMSTFLANLDKNIDYRVVVLPLLQRQLVSSKFIFSNNCSDVKVGARCLGPSEVNTFNNAAGDQGFINSRYENGSVDYGFVNMINNLNDTGMNTGSNRFLRADAQTAVIVVSNGDDIDGAQYYTRSDGVVVMGSYDNTRINQYADILSNFKNKNGLSYYPVVANSTSCLNNRAYVGTRYNYMAQLLNSYPGRSGSAIQYNLCAGQLPYILNDISRNVKTLVQNVMYDYVMLNVNYGTPDISTMTVKKNGVLLQQSTSDGWQYVGYVENQATSYFPTSGNVRSGYAIKLNGSARYQGTDKLEVNFSETRN